MNASRFLPTAAFSVAVSFFFIPPVVALVKSAPAARAAATNANASLLVKSEPLGAPLRVQRGPAAAPAACTPPDTSASSNATDGKRSPWNPWVVASAADR